MATINHKKYDEATETFKDFYVYDGKETLIFKVDGEAGNVGIGTTSPSSVLHIKNSAPEIVLEDSDAANRKGKVLANNGNLGLFADSDNVQSDSIIYFNIDSSERMRITSAGLVGIGVVPNQGSELQVAGTIDAWASLNTLLRMRHDGTRGLIQGYTSGAASTIALNADGGNVGIGTASPEGKLHVLNGSAGSVTANGNADELIVENSSTGGLSILTPDASTGYIIFGSPADNEGAIIRYQPTGTLMTIGTEVANGQLAFRTAAGTERMRIDSSGNVGIGTDSPANIGAGYTHLAISGATTGVLSIQSGTNRIFSLASIGDDGLLENRTATGSLKFRLATGTTEICAVTPNGLTFNGDTAAANALDDYEEGTFTATLKGGTTDPTTPVTTTANYTKIGRQVTVNIMFTNVNTTGAAGAVRVAGLPFSCATAATGAVTTENFTFGLTRTSISSWVGTSSPTTVNFFVSGNDTSFENLSHNAGSGRYLYTSLTYFV